VIDQGYGVLNGGNMAGAKLIVIYPRPTDIEAFDKRYQEEHVPMAVEKLGGKARIVATKVLGSPQGIPPFHVMAEVYFPSLEALQKAAESEGGKETLAHAVSISTGGSPIVLVAEEQSYDFDE
jgi:uncharacterized protein (TIGR02118 family)